jgi:beta-lactamase superfamily II metal-dependent hydrolase
MQKFCLRLLATLIFIISLSPVYATLAQQLKIIHIDVGQSDATLIIGPTGKTLLFDAALTNNGAKLRQVFDANHLTTLDYFVAGHYHADHIGSIDELLATGITLTTASYDRGASYASTAFNDYAAAVGSKRKTITLGQIIDLGGGVTAECVAVNGQTPNGTVSTSDSSGADDENSHSISLVIRYGTFDYIVSSDLTGGGISPFNNTTKADIESKVAAYVGDVDVVHANHHGSSTSSNQTWIDMLKPQHVVISTGNGNTYGHPSQDVLDRYTASSTVVNILQTEAGNGGTSPKVKVGGDITFSTDGSTYTITTTTGYNATFPTDGVTKGQTNQPNFSIAATPASQSVPDTGATTSYTVNISRLNNFTSSVNFSVSGLPSGVTATFTPASTTTNSSTLSLTVAATTATGTYPLTITATGGSPSLTRTTSVTLVKLAPAPDFTLSTSPTSQTVTAGNSTSYTVSVNRLNGFSSAVTLSASGLPTGVTASFSTNPTTGNSTTLTTAVAASTTPGTYNFTITGTGGSPSLTRSVSATIIVQSNLHVVINEIAWSGSASNTNDEWIELYNPTSSTVSLTGWKIVSDGGTRIYNLSGSIPAGGYFLVERTQTVTSVTADLLVSNLILTNTGNKLDLQDATGKTVDLVNSTGGAWFAGDNTTAHHTMERVSASVSGDLASNWKSNSGTKRNGTDSGGLVINGTPRSKNSVTP